MNQRDLFLSLFDNSLYDPEVEKKKAKEIKEKKEKERKEKKKEKEEKEKNEIDDTQKKIHQKRAPEGLREGPEKRRKTTNGPVSISKTNSVTKLTTNNTNRNNTNINNTNRNNTNINRKNTLTEESSNGEKPNTNRNNKNRKNNLNEESSTGEKKPNNKNKKNLNEESSNGGKKPNNKNRKNNNLNEESSTGEKKPNNKNKKNNLNEESSTGGKKPNNKNRKNNLNEESSTGEKKPNNKKKENNLNEESSNVESEEKKPNNTNRNKKRKNNQTEESSIGEKKPNHNRLKKITTDQETDPQIMEQLRNEMRKILSGSKSHDDSDDEEVLDDDNSEDSIESLGSNKLENTKHSKISQGTPKTKNPRNETTVFVGGIPVGTPRDQIKKFFTDCGRIQDVRVVNPKDNTKPTCVVFIQFKFPLSAAKACDKNGEMWKERRLQIKFAQSGKSETGYSLLVKNIPIKTDEEKLRTLFNDCGEIKDLFLIKRGGSTCVAFIYFKTEEARDEAKSLKVKIDGKKLILVISPKKPY